MHVETSGVGGRNIPQTKSNNSNNTNKTSKTNNNPVKNIVDNISNKVDNTKTTVTSNISKLGDSLSIVGNKIADTANQTKNQVNNTVNQTKNQVNNFVDQTKNQISSTANQTKNQVNNFVDQTKTQISNTVNQTKKQVSNVASQAKDKINQSTAAISNTVAKGISITDGIDLKIGAFKISTSASVSQKVGNDKNGTITTNVDVSSGKPKVNVSHENLDTNVKIEDGNIKAGTNGIKISIADNNYYSSDLSIGGTSFSKKSAEVTLFEHSIETKPAANNMTSEIKTSVSVDTDKVKIAAGAAVVAAGTAALVVTKSPRTIPTISRGLTMVRAGFAR